MAIVKSLTLNLQYCTVEDNNKEMTFDEVFKKAQKYILPQNTKRDFQRYTSSTPHSTVSR
jgi:hypothetical protein